MSNDKKISLTFDVKKTEGWTYKLTEEEYARFKHLPTPCAIIGFKPKKHYDQCKNYQRCQSHQD